MVREENSSRARMEVASAGEGKGVGEGKCGRGGSSGSRKTKGLHLRCWDGRREKDRMVDGPIEEERTS